MIFYRIEHISLKKEKVNYYNGPYSINGWKDEDHYTDEKPIPADDIGIGREFYKKQFFINSVCGFISIDQIKKWFSKNELKKLDRLGFIIAKYDSDTFLIGQKQAVFVPISNRIESIKIVNYLFY